MGDDAFPARGLGFPIERSGLEPELRLQKEAHEGGLDSRSGLEPEMGGALAQRGVYVDETTCIGCRYCSHVARNTFYIEPDYGRSRAIRQDGDPPDLIQEAIETCPVDCIHWVTYAELSKLEEERPYQVLQVVGMPADPARISARRRSRRKAKRDSRLQ